MHGQKGRALVRSGALTPDVAAAFFVAQFIEIGELLGRFRARLPGVVDDQATRRCAVENRRSHMMEMSYTITSRLKVVPQKNPARSTAGTKPNDLSL